MQDRLRQKENKNIYSVAKADKLIKEVGGEMRENQASFTGFED